MRTLAMLVAGLLSCTSVQAGDVTVFAAASLTEVVNRLAGKFTENTGLNTVVSFAGSSVLARQIRRGAPADVMISANAAWMEHLAEAGALAADLHSTIAGNRLALITRADDLNAATTVDAVMKEEVSRIAIGDPDHVPVGIYARQALKALGFWKMLGGRVTPSGNTRSALAFVQRGAVRYGIVYRTDALAFDDVRVVAEIPATSHDPIEYQAAVTQHGETSNKADAVRFYQYLSSPDAMAILGEAGFLPCRQGGC